MRGLLSPCVMAAALLGCSVAHPTRNDLLSQNKFSGNIIPLLRDASTDGTLGRAAYKTSNNVAATKEPVQLEMFVMSKCPDARDCVRNLILPAMARVYPSGIVSLRPTFIGTPDESNGGIACMHGPDECRGDMIELCAYDIYKPRPEMWLGFINCLGSNYQEIPDPDFVHECSKEFGMSIERLSTCAASDEPDGGVELLRSSARRAIDLNVRTSCTVQVQGKTVCVRDSGAWKGCSGSVEDLVTEIQKAYDEQD